MNNHVQCRLATGKWGLRFFLVLAWLCSALSSHADTLLSTTTFSYSGQIVQTYTVPTGANYVVIKAWGGGGGGAYAYTGWSGQFFTGSAGDFMSATYDVVPAVELRIVVGGGGNGHAGTYQGSASFSAVYAGGWPGGGDGTALVGRDLNFGVHPSYANGGAGGGGFSRVESPYGNVWAGGGGGAGAGNSLLGSGVQGYPEQGGAGATAAGGGGGGFQGGNAGGSIVGSYTWGGGWAEGGHGTNGSSFASGLASALTQSNPGGGYGLGGTQASPQGGHGRVIVEAYTRSAVSNTQTFVGTAATQPSTYVVPSGIYYVVVKAWGSGGANGVNSSGGAGAFARASYSVVPGQPITLVPGYAGGASVVTLSSSAFLYAGGGGGGGNGSGTSGGVGGASNGTAGGGVAGAAGGAGGTTSGSGTSAIGVGGAGGVGNASHTDYEYDEENNEIGSNTYTVGDGSTGGTGQSASGGAAGDTGDNGLSGGRGGGGFGGGGGGGSGVGGGGGGGGGSSVIVGSGTTPVANELQAGVGATAPNTGDADYPGAGVGAGGGAGAIIIIAYPNLPVLGNTTTQVVPPNQEVNYWITASNSPTSFSATGLPPGLTFNSVNGKISGVPTTPGSYAVVLGASNAMGTTQMTVMWQVDNTPPTAPTTIQAGDKTATSLTLSWARATDNVGVAAYEVWLNGASLGVTAVTQMGVQGLLPNTQYAVRVKTRDLAGNWSTSEINASVSTPPDTTAPSAPTNLKVTNLSATFLTLEWTPSTDDVGVFGYEVARDDAVVTSPSLNKVTITGLAPNTSYRFKVHAADSIPNWSAWSQEITVKTAMSGADTLLTTTVFAPSGQAAQPYTVPADADYVVIKVWGAGGGSGKQSSLVSGGNGGFTSATYPVTPGQIFSVSVGQGGMASSTVFTANGQTNQANAGSGGWPTGGAGMFNYSGGGGGYSSVVTPNGAVWAQGGRGEVYGGFGLGGVFSGLGSTYATGQPYNISHSNPESSPLRVTDPDYPGSRTGHGGVMAAVNGGSGGVVILAYKNPEVASTVGRTYFPASPAIPQTYTVPPGADHLVIKAWGGGGGGSENSDGGGGNFATNSYSLSAGQTVTISVGAGGSWENDGEASVVTLPGNVTLTAAGGAGGTAPSGSAASGTNDSHYPGNNIGYGGLSIGSGTNAGNGGTGAVVIVTYFNPPVITSPLSYFTAPNAPVNYTITATNGPISFSATGLPAGLTLNPSTGVISGHSTASGNSTISATNAGGKGADVILTWTFGTDSTSPNAPTGLQATAIYSNSFLLSWNAAYDNFGVTGYEVRRGLNGSNWVSLGAASTSCTMAILGLAANTSYDFQVRARDGAGNWSAEWSTALTVTTTTQSPPSSTVATSTFASAMTTQTYTVPTGASYIVVKAWGSGGSAGESTGGAGAFISAAFGLSGGQTIGVSPGYNLGPNGIGDRGATKVALPGNTVLFAGAGGAGGEHPAGRGGAGGAPLGENGGGGLGNSGGGGGRIGSGGTGGYGDGIWDVDDGPTWVGGGTAGGVTGQYNGGAGGDKGNQGSPFFYNGGGGGGGLTGGGGGGGGAEVGGGGGGGGSSGIVVGTLSPLTSLMLAGDVATAPNTSDPNYPGNGVAQGGANGGNGGNGFVAILAYSGPPLVTSVLAKTVVQYQPVSYAITIGGQATSFAAAGLPVGLALDPFSGVISGSIAATGTYSSIIGATSASGTAQATLVWTVTADNSVPTVPQGLVASNVTQSSFRLAWTPSTDNVAVSGYQVFKDGVSVGTGATAYLDLTGLTAGTTYSFTVKARDGVGNWSAESAALGVTISVDTQVPTTVAGLALAGQTATTAALTWAAAGDNFGVVAYEVYDGGTFLGSTVELSYVHTGTGSHTYTVLAVDAAGKKSAVSATLSVGAPPGGALADGDGDGIPDNIETASLLSTSPTNAANTASGTAPTFNLHRPNP